MIQNPSRQEIGEILKKAKKIAVVGLSDNPDRTSYMVSKAMQDNGYEIIPVNPAVKEVLGVKAISSLPFPPSKGNLNHSLFYTRL